MSSFQVRNPHLEILYTPHDLKLHVPLFLMFVLTLESALSLGTTVEVNLMLLKSYLCLFLI